MTNRYYETIEAIISRQGLLPEKAIEIHPLSGDGSDRVFFRVRAKGIKSKETQSYFFIFPSPTHPSAMKEAEAAFHIGRHLHMCTVPVPEIIHFDPQTGCLVCEDCGDILLQERCLTEKHEGRCREQMIALYAGVLEALARMQVQASTAFQPDWCWETQRYSRELMLQRESGYFLEAFATNLCRDACSPPLVQKEFELLADRVLHEPNGYVMHRDFQSRNIMVLGDSIRIIDFQGARLGPLAYDLASLVNDPYVDHDEDVRSRLLDIYIERIKKHISLDRDTFLEGYYYIALQRNLQILGAFAYLTLVKEKPFFWDFIQPAFRDLKRLLLGPLAGAFPELSRYVVHHLNLPTSYKATLL